MDKMNGVYNLAANFIGKKDREKLKSFAGHTIAHGRVTRWHWDKDADGDHVFEIYRGGEDEVLTARINRERDRNSFYALDATGDLIASGVLEHVFSELEAHFARLHGELPNTSL